MERSEQIVRNVGDVTAAAGVIAVLSKLVTVLAAVASLLWTVMRIYEMVTGKPFHLTRSGEWLRRVLRV